MSDAFDRLDENNRMQSLKACRDKHHILFTKMTGKVWPGKPRSAPSTENYVTSCVGQENFLLRHRRWYLENQRHNRENHRQTVTTYRTNRILAPTADRQTETERGKRRSDNKYQYKHTKMKRTGKGGEKRGEKEENSARCSKVTKPNYGLHHHLSPRRKKMIELESPWEHTGRKTENSS